MDNPVDTRLEYVGKYVTKSLRLKPDKWGRLLAVDEQRDQVLDFLNRPDLTVMLVLQNTAATLAIVTGFPASIKSKAVYFIKKSAQAVTKDNMEELLIPGDIAPKAIEHLACLVEEVFVPILSNPDNHTTWPAAVAQDIHMHVHGLKSTVYQVKGQVTGQTVLAMPVGVERVDQAERDLIRSKGEIVDLYLKSAIEGVIIKWATQINDVITEDSAQAFANGNNPVPYEEVAFWDARLRNLRYIYQQLRDERVRKMAVILEKTDSAYFPCFKTLFRNIVAALAEAQDISLYLKPLLRHFKVVEETDFSELSPHLMPLVHVVCLVWSNSRYYCTSSKIIILLRQICNLLIQQAKKYLDPSSIFQSDVMEAKERIKDVVTTLTMFRKVFDNRREKIATYFEDREPVLWNFHPNMVFERFNAFLARLATIETFFDTVTEFMKLEKVEVGGLQGRALSAQIGGVFADFSELLLRFAAKAGDALAPEDGAFARDYAAFQRRVEHLDRRLAALFCLAFDDCSNLESVFKLIEIVGTVLDRPLIEREFTAKYAQVLDRLDQDVAVSEELYEEQMREYARSGSMPVDLHMPPVAGAMRWARMLARRDAFSVQRFRELNHP
ncbi:hypothetical protein R5R35_001448 [Gryllus longicercus]|uniref:Dynein heavy chain tail domain-containing protein n=1 Tax=Gryllus longicercus TaxID=2509291 RepID=A0AAN9Z6A5_9ORTH